MYGKLFDFNVAEWREPEAGDIECYKRLQRAYGAMSLSMKILHDFTMKIVRDEVHAEPTAVATAINKALAAFQAPERDDDETKPELTVCNEWMPNEMAYNERAQRIQNYRRSR